MQRCAECGFIALRSTQTRMLVEVDGTIRHRATHGGSLVEFVEAYELDPVCFVQAFDLPTEGEGHSWPIAKILPKPRDCPKFVLWKQGFSPKEHQQMIDSLELINRQNDQRERDRQWEERREDAMRRWEEKRDQEAAYRDKLARRSSLIGNIVNAIIAGGLGLLAVYIASRSGPSQQPDPPSVTKPAEK
jgi:hypothetical protein